MATLTTNISQVIKNIKTKFELLEDREYLLRPLAVETIPLMKTRIHRDGEATDNSQIGTYSNGYMAARQKAGRGESRKIIVALTSKLEEDWQALKTERGWAIGFNAPFNAQKARWVEEGKGKIIFNLSADEKKYISERLQELINGAINP